LEHDQAGLASDGWAAKFFYLTNIIFLEKLAREILEKIKKKYRPKIIMLTIHSFPKLVR
jgi:protoheme ferro-lyase